jgi:uncharacterized protein HemX
MKRTLKRLSAATLIVVVLALSLAGSATVTAAGQRTPRVNRREWRQTTRIRRGVRNGSLTRREAGRLTQQQARIHRHEARIKADGTVTARERASLARQQNRASRNVYRQKHDSQRRN